MPVFAYKAVTESGLVVKNKIEETNKHSVVQRLKRNNLMPISIMPVRGLILNSKKQKKERKNSGNIHSYFRWNPQPVYGIFLPYVYKSHLW